MLSRVLSEWSLKCSLECYLECSLSDLKSGPRVFSRVLSGVTLHCHFLMSSASTSNMGEHGDVSRKEWRGDSVEKSCEDEKPNDGNDCIQRRVSWLFFLHSNPKIFLKNILILILVGSPFVLYIRFFLCSIFLSAPAFSLWASNIWWIMIHWYILGEPFFSSTNKGLKSNFHGFYRWSAQIVQLL